MRVMSKPEFDDSVRYSELELLLENFGVQRDSGQSNHDVMSQDSDNLQIMEDESISVNEPPRSVASEEGIVFIDDKRPNFEFKKQQD